MNCYETVARLHLYIGRELNAEEVVVVQQHLKDCPHCECRFHFDMQVQRLIHERCTIEHAPAHLREAVLRVARQPLGGSAKLDPEVEMEIRADIEDCEDCE
jgi:mycothiol system anti-sigma-R factor